MRYIAVAPGFTRERLTGAREKVCRACPHRTEAGMCRKFKNVDGNLVTLYRAEGDWYRSLQCLHAEEMAEKIWPKKKKPTK